VCRVPLLLHTQSRRNRWSRCSAETERRCHATEGVGSRRCSPGVESDLIVDMYSASLRMQTCLYCTAHWRCMAVRMNPGGRPSPSLSCMERVVGSRRGISLASASAQVYKALVSCAHLVHDTEIQPILGRGSCATRGPLDLIRERCAN
jgi:hypothetical protein